MFSWKLEERVTTTDITLEMGKQNSFVTGQICGQSACRAKFKAEEEWKC